MWRSNGIVRVFALRIERSRCSRAVRGCFENINAYQRALEELGTRRLENELTVKRGELAQISSKH